MNIIKATTSDFTVLDMMDLNISEKELAKSINNKRINLLMNDNEIIGMLRFNLFWDNTPFINFIYIKEKYRDKNYGTMLLNNFEKEMKDAGYKLVLTSSLSSEKGQFFFRKNNYLDCGVLLLPNESSELFFYKEI